MTRSAVQEMSRRGLIAGLGAGAAILRGRPARAAALANDFVVARMQDARIPGLAVGLAKEGRVVSARGYGFADLERQRPATAETMFHIASITKTVTASAVMVLVDEGRIALDEPVAPHLDFPIAGDPGRAITFRHLLTHTSGISDAVYYSIDFRRPGADAEMSLEALLRDYLAPGGRHTGSGNVAHPPGARWDYSNIGYALLGRLAGQVAGQDMRGLARRRLFSPLGLSRMAWTLAETPERLRATPYDVVDGKLTPTAPVGFPDWPAGMLRASVGDLTRLVAAAANGGSAGGVRVLSSKAAAEMLTLQAPAGLPDWLTGQGLGWQQSLLDGAPRINHWGGDPGVFTMAYVAPEHRSAVVLLSNVSATAESRAALKAIAAWALDGLANTKS